MLIGRLLPWLNEAFMLSSAACVAVGWYQIRRGRRDTHRRLMLTGVTLGALFFISYALHTLLVGDTSFGGPKIWQFPYMAFLQVHSVLATVAAVLGVITLRRALRGRFAQHRRIAPWTAVSWFVAAGMGLMVFLLLYVVFPPGPVHGLVRTITGH